jgi:hypothetical protein
MEGKAAALVCWTLADSDEVMIRIAPFVRDCPAQANQNVGMPVGIKYFSRNISD